MRVRALRAGGAWRGQPPQRGSKAGAFGGVCPHLATCHPQLLGALGEHWCVGGGCSQDRRLLRGPEQVVS